MQQQRKTVLAAGFIGNVVEWYDFALYGFMASVFSRIFFPEGDATAHLIAVYGIFAAGFVMRPIGSVMFGWLGDKVGRSRTMMVSVALMAIPTFLLGVLPDYQQIGLAAPILLVALRLLQGLSVGGEFSTSVVYLVEPAPEGRRGLSGSMANLGSVAGTALGSLLAMAVLNLLPESQAYDWGWRIPYLLGGLIGAAALIMRRHLPHSPAFNKQENAREKNAPIRDTLTDALGLTLKSTVFASGYGVFFYLALVYYPNWLSEHAGMDLSAAMRLNTAALVAILPLVLAAGWISDRWITRRRLVMLALSLAVALTWPGFSWSQSGGWLAAVTVQCGLAAVVALMLGGAPALFAEIFPARNRNTGYSMSYALGMGIVGGATPMTATWLIERTGSALAPAAMLAIAALLAGLAAWRMPRRQGATLQPLPEGSAA